ncbi:MAG: competence/damage-inducible protein A [Bdellovibrio sp.]|nr:competence/damage-inducible protein A [Methylotenera sp.]
MQTFGIYIIGDEILSGKREDKHLTQAIAILKARGLQLGWAEYLGDDPSRMVASFKRSFATDDVVFSFGGIGATPDDYTRQAVADALNVPIVRHKKAVAEIEAQFGEGAYPKRVIMADFPQGAGLIPNPVNRVAGFSVASHYFVPGFPAMAHPMMEWVLDTHYSHLFHQTEHLEQSIIVIDGIESKLIDLMNAVIEQFDVKVFSLPKLKPNPHVELGAKGAPDKVLQAMLALKTGVADLGFVWREFESA